MPGDIQNWSGGDSEIWTTPVATVIQDRVLAGLSRQSTAREGWRSGSKSCRWKAER
jgi:hypothetical protein